MIRGLVAVGGLVVAGCAAAPATQGAQAPGVEQGAASELVIAVAGERITMRGRQVADVGSLQRALMEESTLSTVLRLETRGEVSDATLWGVLREVTKAPARRIDLRLGDLSLSVSSRLDIGPSKAKKLVLGQVRQGKLELSAGSQTVAEVPLGDAAAEARGRAGVDAACAAKDCWGIFSLPSDVPLVPTLVAWQRVFGDRHQTLSIVPSLESRPPTEGKQAGGSAESGRLPPEVIQRVVRENFHKFKDCYVAGLSRNPNLLGMIEVRFVINLEGVSTLVKDEGSNLPDLAVRECVLKQFQNLKFPPPEGGIVTVVYPIILRPD